MRDLIWFISTLAFVCLFTMYCVPYFPTEYALLFIVSLTVAYIAIYTICEGVINALYNKKSR